MWDQQISPRAKELGYDGLKDQTCSYKNKITHLQTTCTVVQLFLMVIGGCVFGLGVATRPVLRITKPEFVDQVERILDMMITTGLGQLAMGGLVCLTICWKLMWPIYLAMGLTAMTICLELGSVSTSLYLLHMAESMANEDVVHAWYWVECQSKNSCHDAMLSYIYYFVFPQIFLTTLAGLLQCVGIMLLGQMVRVMADHAKEVSKTGLWYREHMVVPDTKVKSISEKDNLQSTTDPVDQSHKEEVDPDSVEDHTPSSILKADHGYVAASGASLDFDDSYMMRNRSQKEKVAKTMSNAQSISFNANVQVHYYDKVENLGAAGSSKKKRSSMKSTSKVHLISAEALQNHEMDDLSPETLHKSSGKAPSKYSHHERPDLAQVATNLSDLLGGDSPVMPESHSSPTSKSITTTMR